MRGACYAEALTRSAGSRGRMTSRLLVSFWLALGSFWSILPAERRLL